MDLAKEKVKREIKTQVKKEVKKDFKKVKNREEGKMQNKLKKAKQAEYGYGFGKGKGMRGKPNLPTNLGRVLSAWDHMLLAKHFPGEFQAPYVAGMNVLPIPTGVAASSFRLDTAVQSSNLDGARAAIGSNTYLLVAFAPSFTTYFGGNHGPPNNQTNRYADTTRLSGFQCIQSTNPSDVILYQNGFDRNTRSRSCAELYGSDFLSFAAAGFIWSSEMELVMATPMANVVGTAYEGAITVSQIPSSGLSFDHLIRLSQKIHHAGQTFKLRGAIVNHNLAFDIDHTSDSPVGNSQDMFNDLSLETVHFMIFQAPAQDISTGANKPYTFTCNIKSNFAYWPLSTDPMAARIGQPETQADKYIDKEIPDTIPRDQYNWIDPLATGLEWAAGAIPGWGHIAAPVVGLGAKAIKMYLTGASKAGTMGGFPPTRVGGAAARIGSVTIRHIRDQVSELKLGEQVFLNKMQIQLDIERLNRFLNPIDVPFAWKSTWEQFRAALDSLADYVKNKDDVFVDDTEPSKNAKTLDESFRDPSKLRR